MTKRRKITRRAVVGAGALVPISASSWARGLARSGVGAAATQTIASINLSGTVFSPSTPNSTVGTITVTMSPTSPPFAGTVALNTTSPFVNSGGFQIVGSGPWTLETAGGGGTPTGTYTDVKIQATQAGISNSPQAITPTLVPTGASQAFITGTTFGMSYTGSAGLLGMMVQIGSSNILVTDIGRYVQPGSSQTHTLGIMDVATCCFNLSGLANTNCCLSPMGDSLVSLVANGSAPGFQYVTLSTPVILEAGKQYFFVSSELQGGGNDPIYISDSSYTTTVDAVLIGPCSYNPITFSPWFFNSVSNSGNGPINFKYSLTSTPASLPGSPFYTLIDRNQYGGGDALATQSLIGPVAGMVTLDCGFYFHNAWWVYGGNGGTHPASAIFNTLVAQWIIDETIFSPYIIGPQNYPNEPMNPLTPCFPWTFDTSSGPYALADGTHHFRIRIIDSFSSPFLPDTEPYRMVKCGGGALLVANSGPLTDHYAQARMPVFETAESEQRLIAGTADFVNYPGDTFRAINTFDYPEANVPPVYSPSFPLSRLAPRSYGLYIENFLAKRLQEYETEPCWITTTSGGVACSQYHSTGGLSFSQAQVPGRVNFNWDGGRYDNRGSPLSLLTFSPDITGAFQGYIGAEIQGRIIHVGYNGAITTLWGRTLDRAGHLQLDGNNASYTDAQVGAVLAMVGTIGSPGFTQWWGLNDITFDPTDTSGPGGCSQTCFVTNPATNIIIKITGLFGTIGTAVATLYAGIENPSNTSSTGNGGLATSANIGYPLSVICNTAGDLYVTDNNNSEIRIIDKATQHINHAYGLQAGKPDHATYQAAQTPTSNTYCGGTIGNTVANASAFINFPAYIQFASNGDIVVVEAGPQGTGGMNNFRRIGIGSGNTTFIGYPYAYTNSGNGPGITTVSSFAQFDIDQCRYPTDYRGGSPVSGYGAFGPEDDIFFMTPPEGDATTTSNRMSIDGTTYNAAFTGDGGIPTNISFQGSNGDDFGTTISEGGPLAPKPDPGVGVYSWFVGLSKTRAHIVWGGFRYNGFTAARIPLPSDPDPMIPTAGADPTANYNIFALGQSVWRGGSALCFPFGLRPPFAMMHGFNGFGALGSDVAPTIHDMAVVYNGGTAAYQGTLTPWPISSMTLSAGHIAIVMTNSGGLGMSSFVEQVGNWVDITGNGNSTFNGFFLITAYTDPQHFTIAAPGASGTSSGSPVINTGDAILQKFIQNGGTGSTPRPEIVGVYWQALSFWIRRSTTAGSFPGPVALPAPNPSTPWSQVVSPVISNVVATQLSHTSIRVTWTTDQPTIGLACAGSNSIPGTSIQFAYRYASFSPLETVTPLFAGAGFLTSHNVVITNLPDTVGGPSVGPIHFSVVSMNVSGKSSYAPDQTITIT